MASSIEYLQNNSLEIAHYLDWAQFKSSYSDLPPPAIEPIQSSKVSRLLGRVSPTVRAFQRHSEDMAYLKKMEGIANEIVRLSPEGSKERELGEDLLRITSSRRATTQKSIMPIKFSAASVGSLALAIAAFALGVFLCAPWFLLVATVALGAALALGVESVLGNSLSSMFRRVEVLETSLKRDVLNAQIALTKYLPKEYPSARYPAEFTSLIQEKLTLEATPV